MPIDNPSRSKTKIAGIAILLAVATALRFWRLETKPLWIDELYTLFYSLGQSPTGVPLNQLQPLSAYRALLTLNSHATSLDAQRAVTTFSNHPPVFFMLMNGWMQQFGTSIIALRSLPAIFGILLVGAVRSLGNHLGKPVGWIAAILMTISPYGVYLSQEARHYTLPMLISTLSLVVWLGLLRSLHQKKSLHWKTLSTWVLLNGLGFYTHYFYFLGVLVQWSIMLAHLYRWQSSRRNWGIITGAILCTGLCCLAWLPVILQQGNDSGEAMQWLNPDQPFWEALVLPWLRSLAAWVMMVILLPVEQVPLGVTIPSALIMIGVWGWGVQQVIQGWGVFRRSSLTATSQMVLTSLQLYGLGVFALMMAIVYGFHKDLTLAPRYFFILYPALVVVMAVGWTGQSRRKLAIWVAAGLASILLMGGNWTLLKPYWPEKVGLSLTSQEPNVVIMVAREPVRRLLGLSYALTLPETSTSFWGFTTGIPDSGDLRSQLQGWEQLPPTVTRLWLLEPQRVDVFPSRITLPKQICVAVGHLMNTQGTRQQAYQCQLLQESS